MYTSSGVLNLLRYGGLEVRVLAADHWWTGLTAITSMGLFPANPHRGSRVVVAPLEWASKLWWRLAALREPRVQRGRPPDQGHRRFPVRRRQAGAARPALRPGAAPHNPRQHP